MYSDKCFQSPIPAGIGDWNDIVVFPLGVTQHGETLGETASRVARRGERRQQR